MPRLSAIGLAPAATVFTPSRKMAWASTVAVVVPSPATSEVLDATSRTICAPMFSSGSCSSISFATVTPSLVMIGAPNFFSITALRPLGPSVIFTASARTVDAAQNRLAGILTSHNLLCHDVFTPPFVLRVGYPVRPWPRPGICCLGGGVTFCRAALASPAELREDLVFAQDQVFLAIKRDVVAAVFAEQDAVAGLYVERDQFSLFRVLPAPTAMTSPS